MEEILNKALKIRYIKLYFTVAFTENTTMPKYKASAIRGGIGEMLLRVNCIRDRDCANCDFESECIVRRTMYSKFDIEPSFKTEGESIGFTLDCNNRKEQFKAGDRLTFQLTLFGKTIVYFSQYLQAVHSLGMEGIGKYHSRFQIVEVLNSRKQPLLDGENVYMQHYVVESVMDYVEHRMQQMDRADGDCFLVRFDSPVTLKYQGEFLNEFDIEPILKTIKRRIYMLDCFEGIPDVDIREMEYQIPVLCHQQSRMEAVPRYSSRQNSSMVLRGIRGNMILQDVDMDVLMLLLAGEIIHIGKNTRFGFGNYYVKKEWLHEIYI